MDPTFFATPKAFRKWFEKHHAEKSELLVGFYKRGSGEPSITWPESVDQALCFGWIDGVRRRIDDDSYSIRFTPRKSLSNWSAINIKRVAELTKLGLMARLDCARSRNGATTSRRFTRTKTKCGSFRPPMRSGSARTKKRGHFSPRRRRRISAWRSTGSRARRGRRRASAGWPRSSMIRRTAGGLASSR